MKDDDIQDKPPIGLMPERIFIANQNCVRIDQIVSAIERYSAANTPIPIFWVRELRIRLDAKNADDSMS